MIDEKSIGFSPVKESDFLDFMTLRKAVMKEHVLKQGLPWDEAEENRYHRELFDAQGLRSVSFQGKRIGYVGVREEKEENRIVIGRLCFLPEFQNKGIGTAVMKKIFAEPLCQGKLIFLDVLLVNPAIRLYERLGFVRKGQDDKLAFYERIPENKTIASPNLHSLNL